MDPDRIHSYLKAACIGLGFDIGEVWWTSTTEKATASTKITRNSPGESSVTMCNCKKSGWPIR